MYKLSLDLAAPMCDCKVPYICSFDTQIEHNYLYTKITGLTLVVSCPNCKVCFRDPLPKITITTHMKQKELDKKDKEVKS